MQLADTHVTTLSPTTSVPAVYDCAVLSRSFTDSKSCALRYITAMKSVGRKPRNLVRWGVFYLQKKGHRIGSVEAPDDPDRALARAKAMADVKTYDPRRISVQREV
jgi:hypothetical protein